MFLLVLPLSFGSNTFVADRDDAGLAAGLRQGQPDHPPGRDRPRPDDRRPGRRTTWCGRWAGWPCCWWCSCRWRCAATAAAPDRRPPSRARQLRAGSSRGDGGSPGPVRGPPRSACRRTRRPSAASRCQVSAAHRGSVGSSAAAQLRRRAEHRRAAARSTAAPSARRRPTTPTVAHDRHVLGRRRRPGRPRQVAPGAWSSVAGAACDAGRGAPARSRARGPGIGSLEATGRAAPDAAAPACRACGESALAGQQLDRWPAARPANSRARSAVGAGVERPGSASSARRRPTSPRRSVHVGQPQPDDSMSSSPEPQLVRRGPAPARSPRRRRRGRRPASPAGPATSSTIDSPHRSPMPTNSAYGRGRCRPASGSRSPVVLAKLQPDDADGARTHGSVDCSALARPARSAALASPAKQRDHGPSTTSPSERSADGAVEQPALATARRV